MEARRNCERVVAEEPGEIIAKDISGTSLEVIRQGMETIASANRQEKEREREASKRSGG